jgi:hypothetical protein
MLKGCFKRNSIGTNRLSKKRQGDYLADNQLGTGEYLQSMENDMPSVVAKSPTSELLLDPCLETQQALGKDKTLNKIRDKSIHTFGFRLASKYEDGGKCIYISSSRVAIVTVLNSSLQRLCALVALLGGGYSKVN